MEKIKLMNMCKIKDNINEMILVQQRIKNWKGIAFPGGKIEWKRAKISGKKMKLID